MAILGQNFGNNIGFESEIYSYSVGIHKHCRDIVSNFYNIVPTLLFGRGPNRVMETACFDANVQ